MFSKSTLTHSDLFTQLNLYFAFDTLNLSHHALLRRN